MRSQRLVRVLGVVGLLLSTQMGVHAQDDAGERHSGLYERYAVAADHPVASAAGAEILAKGGNAVDAAVAASFTLSVVRPFSCGIGGGGFMMISLPSENEDGARTERAICYRETAPAGATRLVYEGIDNQRASLDGGTACGVPGTVAGLLYALENYGTLDRETVMAPAIRAALNGFTADAAFVSAVKGAVGRFERDDSYQERFASTWEQLLGRGEIAVGDVIRNPEQASLLEAIAREGEDAFYTGDVAASIRAAVNADAKLNGFIGEWFGETDLASPFVEDLDPIGVMFAGRRVLLMPPPSSGGIAIGQTFGLLERQGLSQSWDERRNLGSRVAYTHGLIEAFKFAFAGRARYLADTRFDSVPTRRMLSEDRLDEIARCIDPERTFGPEHYGSFAQFGDDDGTSHISVIDADGGAAACTETINTGFGSLLVVPGLGFCMNNEMDDFTTRRGVANAYGLQQSETNLPRPGKRPLSSMSPTIVLLDDEPEIVAGASGGPRIITATAQTILNVLVREMNAAEAVRARRMHHQWVPASLFVERGFDKSEAGDEGSVTDALGELGHEIKQLTSSAVVQMVRKRADGMIEAASDPRKGGRPAGE